MGPGRGCQAVSLHPAASPLSTGMAPAQPPARGGAAGCELGLRQSRDLPGEHMQFSIFSSENALFKAASLHRKGYVLTSLLIALVLLKHLYLEVFVKSHIDTFQRRMVCFLL